VVVLDNGHFGETGMQVSHTGLGVDLSQIAAAAGFAAAVDIRDSAGLEGLARQLREASGGPRFATVRVSAVAARRTYPPRDGVFVKNRFRQHLGYSVS
jgi:hypothetical protein